MDAIEAILTRKSVRKFTSQPIEPEKLHLLLEAAMSAPSATNARDWAYIVVNARETLEKMADGNGKYASRCVVRQWASSFAETCIRLSARRRSSG